MGDNIFHYFPIIKTDRYYLDKLDVLDATQIFKLRSDPKVLKYLGREPAESIDAAKEWIILVENSYIEKKGINWAIREQKNGELIGTIGFWKLMPERFRAEIGYSLLAEYHGQGIMTECCKSVIRFAFETIKLHSIQAEIDPYNDVSRKLLEKLHFRKEAHFTEDFYFREQFSDSAIYSLLEKWYVYGENQKGR